MRVRQFGPNFAINQESRRAHILYFYIFIFTYHSSACFKCWNVKPAR